jgi:AcrR family transcriptional regulator
MVAASGARKSVNGTLPQLLRAPVAASSAADRNAAADKARMERLLAVAKATFSQKGFAATTMDDIATAAGMSKKTLYKLFDSKTALFRTMLTHSLPNAPGAGDQRPAATAIDALRLSLKRISDIALAPGEIALHRLIVSERASSPDIAKVFSEVIFNLGADSVVDSVKRVQLKPYLHDLPAKWVAEMLLGMVFGNDHFRLMVDDSYKVDRRRLNKRIDLAVTMFCED